MRMNQHVSGYEVAHWLRIRFLRFEPGVSDNNPEARCNNGHCVKL